jgi:hypothetical protein
LRTGDEVTLSSGDASVTLPVRVDRALRRGLVRVAHEYAGGVQGRVELSRTEVRA